MNTSVWGATRRRVIIYSCALVVGTIIWVVFAWAYEWAQNASELPPGKGRLDLWMQFLSGGWAGDLVEKVENGVPIPYSRRNLSYLISAGFIIQGLMPTVTAVWILVELIELRWRTHMRASGLLLENQDMMARSFREIMLKLLPEEEREKRRYEMDWLSQNTAYEVAERWCQQRGPREMGKEAAAQALTEIRERREDFEKKQPRPEGLKEELAPLAYAQH